MDIIKDKNEKMEDNERKKKEFSKTWIGRMKWLQQNKKEKRRVFEIFADVIK